MYFSCALQLLILNVFIMSLGCSPVRKREKLSMQAMSGYGKRAPFDSPRKILNDILEQALMSFDSEYASQMTQDPVNGGSSLLTDIPEQRNAELSHSPETESELQRLVFWLEQKYGLRHQNPPSIDSLRGETGQHVTDSADQYLQITDSKFKNGPGNAIHTWLETYGDE